MRQEEFDVVVVGGGGAGCSAAIAAADAGARTALVSKEPVGYGNTRLSGGWMICLDSGVDSPQKLRDDILRNGRFINDLEMVEAFAAEVVAGTAFLESLGQIFVRDDQGQLRFFPHRGTEHSHPRSLKSDAQGVSYGHSLRSGVVGANVALFEEAAATRIVAESGGVQGIVCLDICTGEVFNLAAKAVILATGGAGQLFYPHTHNSRSTTGDGYALGLSCGAELINMEQVQFRSFSPTHPRCYEGLGGISASQGRLVNGLGEVFVEDVGQTHMAQLTRAIAEQIWAGKATPFGGVSLDLSRVGQEQRRRMVSLKSSTGNEIIKYAYGRDAHSFVTPVWDVAPTEMYYLGGVKVDKDGESRVKGLYAVGECSSGLHGGARVPDIALAELFVFGPRAGRKAAEWALGAAGHEFDGGFREVAALEEERIGRLYGCAGTISPVRLKRSLQDCLWKNVGLFRDQNGLKRALEEIAGLEALRWGIATSDNKTYNTEVLDALELDFMLLVAKSLAHSALERNESRGFHWRTDFPEEADALYNVVVSEQNQSIAVRRELLPNRAGQGARPS